MQHSCCAFFEAAQNISANLGVFGVKRREKLSTDDSLIHVTPEE